jgi:autotransporter passenger strand-loop-strand repeat protein
VQIQPIVVSGATAYHVLAGHVDDGDIVLSGGTIFVDSGAVASSAVVSAGGSLVIAGGGSATSSTVRRGGTEIVASGGVVTDETVSSGGVLVVRPIRRRFSRAGPRSSKLAVPIPAP